MKEYLRKNGIRVGIIVAAVVLIIGLGTAARGGRIGFVQNARGTASAPLQKVLSSAANWFDTIYGYLYLESSKVVLWSSSNWSSSFTISKGARSGIEYGDPVITEYGALVGQITELGETWSTVSTLIDVDMSVGGTVVSTGSSGMVVGEYSLMKQKKAKLTFLADGAQIFAGDEVTTSGSGGAFPAGLVIGTVTSVQTEAGGQIEYGIVEPQANLDSLVQVFIIKDFDVVE